MNVIRCASKIFNKVEGSSYSFLNGACLLCAAIQRTYISANHSLCLAACVPNCLPFFLAVCKSVCPICVHVLLVLQTALAPLMQTTREMGSMTEAEMKDVLLQTVQTEEKAIHVVLSEPEPVAKQNLTATATQTERQQRRTGARVQPQQFLQMKVCWK